MSSNKLGPRIDFFVKKKISVFLRTGVILKGILIGFDQFMNLVIEKVYVKINGNEECFGTTIIRGNEVSAIELLENQ